MSIFITKFPFDHHRNRIRAGLEEIEIIGKIKNDGANHFVLSKTPHMMSSSWFDLLICHQVKYRIIVYVILSYYEHATNMSYERFDLFISVLNMHLVS